MIHIEKQTALASANHPSMEAPQLKARFLKISSASAYSSISRSRLYELLNAGKIKSHKIGGARLLDRESLDSFISSQPA